MLKYFIFILLIIMANFSVFAQENLLDPIEKSSTFKAELFLKKAAFSERCGYADWDLVYQRMEWQVNPSIKYIKGAVTSYFKIENIALEKINFDLSQSLTVDSVLYHNQPIDFTHQNNILEIPDQNSINFSSLDSLTVFYKGIPCISGLGSFEKSSHESSPIIWTLSEPYGAMEWWPCKQSLSDKIDSIDVIVTCPESFRTASNGVLISENVHDGLRTMKWKHRYPIATYLVAIAVTNYVEYSDYLELENGDSIEILNYVYPESFEAAKTNTARTVEIMALYNNLFGIYPFADEKYGHAQFGWSGGMEHQTMSFMGSFGFGLIAHELAHQWFGDYITLSSWQDIWLNEGFATYLTGLAYESLIDGYWWPVWKTHLTESITSQPDGSVFVTDTTDVNRIFSSRLSYSKGAYILHMLRWVLGDDTFFTALNNYLYDPEITNGFGTQEKLVYHLETEADTSLFEFFNDWYYGEGYPIYSLQYSQNNDNLLRIILSQETTHSSVDFFEMPVQILCYNSDKTDSIDFRLENIFNEQEFIVDPGFQVNEIQIDPDKWIIKKVGSIISSTWLSNPNYVIVFPNPVKDILKLSASHNLEINKIEILNYSGQTISQFPGNIKNIDLKNLPPANYIINIQTTEGSIIKKITKL